MISLRFTSSQRYTIDYVDDDDGDDDEGDNDINMITVGEVSASGYSSISHSESTMPSPGSDVMKSDRSCLKIYPF